MTSVDPLLSVLKDRGGSRWLYLRVGGIVIKMADSPLSSSWRILEARVDELRQLRRRGDLVDTEGAEVFDHGVDGCFQWGGVAAHLAEQQTALDGRQHRQCQDVDVGSVG
jgi:hypothetical protein